MRFAMSNPAHGNRASMVRSFESMNRIPAPQGLRAVQESLLEDRAFSWYEYVPVSYDGSQPVPLVIQLHGGGNDGMRWSNYTIWHLMAEKQGFLVVYPNSPVPGMWTCGDEDIAYLEALIGHLCGKYCVDNTRIYMQGMSNGEMMTLAFTMRHPEMLAAAGNLTGPSPAEMIDDERPVGALPLYQMRGEKDVFFQLPDPLPRDIYAKRYGMNDFNREIWLEANGVQGLPSLTIRGKDNYLVYQGTHAPIINHEIQSMGHREPTDSAQTMWNLLYANARRVDGKPVVELPPALLAGDADGVAVAIGSNRVYKADHIETMHPSPFGHARFLAPPANEPHFNAVNIGEMFETPEVYVPVEGLGVLFGAKTELVDPGMSARAVFPDGTEYVFHADALLVTRNGEYLALRKPSLLVSGMFLVPLGEIATELLGKRTSMVANVMYVSDHHAQLGRYTATILLRLLEGIPEL